MKNCFRSAAEHALPRNHPLLLSAVSKSTQAEEKIQAKPTFLIVFITKHQNTY